MNIQTVKISDIKTADYNPRIINVEQYNGLKNSLKTFGQQENFIVNKDMTLISGHQRLQVSKDLGWKEVVVNIIDVDKKTEKKLNVVMNSRSVQGTFDELKLSELLEELKLEEDYSALRLDTLEPLDLSDIEFDGATLSDEETYKNRAIKQIVLAYGTSEFEEIMHMVDKLIKLGHGNNPTELFTELVGEAYANINA